MKHALTLHHSTGREHEKPDDVLVLCRILHRPACRAATGPSGKHCYTKIWEVIRDREEAGEGDGGLFDSPATTLDPYADRVSSNPNQ
jgi:hypothetical protein